MTAPDAHPDAPAALGRARDPLTQALEDLDRAVRASREHSREWAALEALQGVAGQGRAEVLPYSAEAIAILESAFFEDDGDCHVIHHLAIAYHALAWDLELTKPSAADQAWESALFYWRKLKGCKRFWDQLGRKGEALGSTFDAEILLDLRRKLLLYLLEIHVDFIRYYHQVGRPRDAARHVRLVGRARIAPALGEQLANMAFKGVEPQLIELERAGRMTDAAEVLEGFLALFPASVAGLQKHLELVRTQIEGASREWAGLPMLAAGLEPRWLALSTAERLKEYPLATVALKEVADAVGRKLCSRTNWLMERYAAGQTEPLGSECSEYESCTQAIQWLERSVALAPSDSEFSAMLAQVLANRAQLLLLSAVRFDYGIDGEGFLKRCDDALEDCRRALEIHPGESALQKLSATILSSKANYLNLFESL